ncbi:MAG: HAD-IIA family hydrolase [Candidatus Micrarchaeota archaeon]|nr:HAD-IIA family hydrolase [Candidatus Micrarchaeota archaeon]
MRLPSKIIFDLDGVVYRGHTPVPGVAKAIGQLKAAGIAVAYLTNNATRSRRELLIRLRKMGIPAQLNEVMPSSFAAARYLEQMRPKPKTVFVLGEKGLRQEIKSAGFDVLPPVLKGEHAAATTFTKLSTGRYAPRADVLITGLDRQVSYAKFASALDVLNSGAKWIACNLDPTLPMEHGAHPGSGSLNALLGYAAGQVNHQKHAQAHAASNRPLAALSQIILREPDAVVGKPNPYMLELASGKKFGAAQKARSALSSCLFVGDRLDIDIQFANAAGIPSMLVLTGVATKKEASKAKGLLKPNYILRSAADLPKWLGL